MSIEFIELWHQRARPNPTDKDFNTQLGCHLEEFGEMLENLVGVDVETEEGVAEDYLTDVYNMICNVADMLKEGAIAARIPDANRRAFLDSLADQIVTATGVGHCAGMNTAEAVRRVNTSNFTKYTEDGQPIFDANGKVTKGPRYQPPNLDGLY